MLDEPISLARYPTPGDGLTYEPSQRWVRATIGDVTVVDSQHALLLWEPGRPVAGYLFPEQDVRTDLLTPVPAPAETAHPGVAEWYDLEVDGERYERLVWRYEIGPLAGHLAVDWFGRTAPGIEHWYEEEEEVFVHPRDPHKRVDAIPSSRHAIISIDGRTLADTTRPVLLFETGLPIRYYVPREDVDLGALEASPLRTRCPYKGVATYWSVRGYEPGKDIVWTYEDPIPAALQIKDLLAFYNEAVDITVDGVEIPRPVTPFSTRLANDAPDTTGV